MLLLICSLIVLSSFCPSFRSSESIPPLATRCSYISCLSIMALKPSCWCCYCCSCSLKTRSHLRKNRVVYCSSRCISYIELYIYVYGYYCTIGLAHVYQWHEADFVNLSCVFIISQQRHDTHPCHGTRQLYLSDCYSLSSPVFLTQYMEILPCYEVQGAGRLLYRLIPKSIGRIVSRFNLLQFSRISRTACYQCKSVNNLIRLA